MKPSIFTAVALSISACAALAAPPAEAPAGSTGLCKDGSYVSVPDKKGACRGHKGIKDWYAEAKTTPMAGAAPAVATAPSAPPAAPVRPARPAGPPMPATAAAPGGGPGMVWANDTTKVYHCQNDRWYGKTKHGEYLSESDAKAKGFRLEKGKTCA